MKLYYMSGSCAMADHIALEWTGQTYQAKKMSHEELKTESFLALNPAGSVPVLEDGDWVLTQNAAILGYIADSFPEAGLAGDGTPRGRAEVTRWLAFLNADVHPAFHPLFGATGYLDDAAAEQTREQAKTKLRKLFEQVDKHLQQHDWLAGQRSIADPYLFVATRWARAKGVNLSGYEHLAAFFDRMAADAGVQKVLADEGIKAG